MRRRPTFPLLLCLFVCSAFGCIPEDPVEGTIVLANGTDPEDWKIDPYFVEELKVDRDTLVIVVSYSGGCEEHDFSLVAWSYFWESYPVQAGVLLSHDNHADPCEAIITQELHFDLTPLKREYQHSYQEPHGTIILQILTAHGGEYIPMEYEF